MSLDSLLVLAYRVLGPGGASLEMIRLKAELCLRGI